MTQSQVFPCDFGYCTDLEVQSDDIRASKCLCTFPTSANASALSSKCKVFRFIPKLHCNKKFKTGGFCCIFMILTLNRPISIYIKIQPKTIDLSTRLVGINTEFVGFIPKSLVLRSIVLG